MSSSIANTRSEVWRARVGSALRTTLACTIAGCSSLYGPAPLRRYLEFPSFMYATTVLIVSDATLGDTLRGCWHVLCSNIQVMVLSLLSLQLIGPHNFTNLVAALAMAGSAFAVALPESTNLVTKQLAFGQLVNVYVSTVVTGPEGGVAIHPIHVVCSTAFGAVASVLAMLIPFPLLAYYEIRKLYRLYAKNTCERFDCNIEVISASDNSTAVSFLTQAKSLSTTGDRLHQSITSKLDGMHWERTKVFNRHWIDPEEKQLDLELPIRAMGIALSNCTSFPVGVIDEELRGVLHNCRGQFSKKLNQRANCFDATTTSEMKKAILTKNLSIAYKDLPTSFFLYCVHLLLDDSPIVKKTDHVQGITQKSGDSRRSTRKVVMYLTPSYINLAFAFKSSLTLGLAVFFGLTYNEENGYWAGLLIALCFVTGRHPTFSLANARGQGTAMGSIYGILCCFIFKKIVKFSFLPLLPWVIFSSFLRYSRMYGEAGGIAAITGALLVVGMKHHDTPSQFALARIIEATIGLLCFATVEILFNHCRAATLAKSELSQCLRSLQDCIDKIAFINPTKREMAFSSCQALREGQNKLKSLVGQLEEFTLEAELEPNFWFIPFHSACYRKMLESLSRAADLLLFVAYSMENVMLLSQKNGAFWVDLHDRVNENVRTFKNKVGPTLKFLEEITTKKSPRKLENELNRNIPCDIETQEYPNADAFRVRSGDEEVDSITALFSHI
ncbi:p-hydroxybenzoic acid efflux pump subunit AaeB [Spatholobus suberectus]|nr:p-hydroxybenzoic acid efflux pump subunit AaeB [Spatholobus suberectus]